MFRGNQIRKLREERKYSLAELAGKAGISVSYLSEIERGSKKPSLKTLEKLSKALNVPSRELVKEDPKPLGLGERIRLFREKKGIGLSELAARAELSYSYICEIERGLVSPSIKALKKIASCLNVPVGRIINPDGSLGAKLSAVREEQGLNKAQLARKAGLSPGLIGQIEKGKVQPSLHTLEKLSGALGVSPCFFLTEDNGLEEMLHLFTPEVRKLLLEPQVQSVLKMLCQCNEKEFLFVLEFIKLLKQSRLLE